MGWPKEPAKANEKIIRQTYFMGFRSVMAPVESFPKITKSVASAGLSCASPDASVVKLTGRVSGEDRADRRSELRGWFNLSEIRVTHPGQQNILADRGL